MHAGAFKGVKISGMECWRDGVKRAVASATTSLWDQIALADAHLVEGQRSHGEPHACLVDAEQAVVRLPVELCMQGST